MKLRPIALGDEIGNELSQLGNGVVLSVWLIVIND